MTACFDAHHGGKDSLHDQLATGVQRWRCSPFGRRGAWSSCCMRSRQGSNWPASAPNAVGMIRPRSSIRSLAMRIPRYGKVMDSATKHNRSHYWSPTTTDDTRPYRLFVRCLTLALHTWSKISGTCMNARHPTLARRSDVRSVLQTACLTLRLQPCP